MSNQLVKPQFDKLWEIMDDCIQNKRYTQIQGKLRDEEYGRCILGLFMTYVTGDFGDTSLSIYDGLGEKFEKYKLFAKDVEGISERITEDGIDTKEKVIKNMKDCYMKTGKLYCSYLIYLNDYYDFTFEEFSDVLKEMDL